MTRSMKAAAILFAASGTFAADLFFHHYGLASSLLGAFVSGTITAVLLPLFSRAEPVEASVE